MVHINRLNDLAADAAQSASLVTLPEAALGFHFSLQEHVKAVSLAPEQRAENAAEFLKNGLYDLKSCPLFKSIIHVEAVAQSCYAWGAICIPVVMTEWLLCCMCSRSQDDITFLFPMWKMAASRIPDMPTHHAALQLSEG